ncbi:MAG: hypothetical protein JJE52_08470 [Acidimicrobiia bacterium]|nr:hypothetical protein [Acidimicrobiia bacterium]
MSAVTNTPSAAFAPADTGSVLQFKRRTIDSFLISLGGVATVVLVVAGGLLSWGAGFSADYVDGELSSQNITFPDAAALEAEGRTDLVEFAGQDLNTGAEAEAYASYIDGHLAGIGAGLTYAEMGVPESAAKDAVAAAVEADSSDAQVAELQAEVDTISGHRNSLFKGETLRGLLLTAFAWSTVGQIAGYAAIGAFVAAAIMMVLVALGLRHHRKVVVMES